MSDRRGSDRSTEMEQIPSKKVVFHSPDPSQSPLLDDNEPDRRRFMHSSRRHRTDMNDARRESRAFSHSYLFRRPRALHYKRLDDDSPATPLTSRSRTSTVSSASKTSNNTEDDTTERSTDDITKQRSRLDLFVDLIWVGIIANLSENFGAQAYEESGVGIGIATAEFILLFIVIWRVWDNLRVYMSAFFIDDIMQRKFSVWILLLAVLYGINAPYAYRPGGKTSLTLLIVVYIITKVSFTAAFGVQAIFLPFLRRLFYFQAAATIITVGIWIGAIFCPFPGKLALLIIANVIEQPIGTFLASPTADRLFTKDMKRTPDVDHCVERYEGFFIIILGEGVFRLIVQSPSGLGLNGNTGTVLTALIMYYLIHWLYFNGDQSKAFIHALRRTWWKPVLWQLLHVILFGSLLFLDASVLFLIKNRGANLITDSSSLEARQEGSSTPETAEEEVMIGRFAHYALWVASVTMGQVMFCMTAISLLNRNLDGPKTLVINNRLLRIAPRLPATAFIVCLPVIPGMNGAIWCGATTSVLYGVFMWEWIAGLEKDWKLFEPKEE